MTDPALDKTFDPAVIEAKWYAHWEANGLFRPARPDAVPFTIVNPPPNVTGSLHIGHALDNTLQDIVVRYERLRGKDALWVVGTDHAGIATQMVVERQLEEAQDKRTNYTREDFVDKVWEWKTESGGTITGQLRRLGCSMDWSREQFTMDPHFTTAVTKVFVDLHREGLIYRDKRLVNWDPKLKTAISDLEVETREVQGHFWHFRYPLADGVKTGTGSGHIVVATTRPETMLADMAVAVNAADPRYQSVIGKFVVLPITGRRIPIIADDHADPELGSGAVKITPGHDFNDFEVGKRAGFEPSEMLNMFDDEARVVQCGGIPAEFFRTEERDHGLGPDYIEYFDIGVSREDARTLVIHEMTEQSLLENVEDRVIATPYGDRSGVVIEPWLTDQWYVNAATLAQPPIQAVRDGRIEIVPKSWEKTFFNWMENIQPWCVSRQLWWGHRIPAWYGPAIKVGKVTYDSTSQQMEVLVGNNEAEIVEQARKRYPFFSGEFKFIRHHGEMLMDEIMGKNTEDVIGLWQDPDVLDTWFSSALWPFATLGWPEESPSPLAGEGQAAGQGEGAQASAPSPSLAPLAFPSPARGEGLLARHYPNDLLISGFDILFFWCARMAMQGMHFNAGQVPWKRLYLHGLVRAADGQKMSKSKGNVVDPLVLIDQYGADALRFFMAAMESQGRDVKMDERRVEGYRNFATKLWNAARFCQSNGIGASTSLAAPAATSAVNKWIIGEVVETVAALDQAMADLRFDAAANTIYHFVWDQFCDWYLELIKPTLSVTPAEAGAHGEATLGGTMDPGLRRDDDGGAVDAAETKLVAGWVLDQILVMLHPFMPFVTEELWSKLGDRADYPLITAKWPEPGAGVDVAAKAEVEWLIELTRELRGAKAELGIAPGARLDAYLPDPSETDRAIIERNGAAIEKVARLKAVHYRLPADGASFQIGVGEATFTVSVADVIDIAAEKARLTKALETSTKEAKSLEGRLSNPAFVEKAKPEAVEKARADHALHAAEVERLAAALARLG